MLWRNISITGLSLLISHGNILFFFKKNHTFKIYYIFQFQTIPINFCNLNKAYFRKNYSVDPGLPCKVNLYTIFFLDQRESQTQCLTTVVFERNL